MISVYMFVRSIYQKVQRTDLIKYSIISEYLPLKLLRVERKKIYSVIMYLPLHAFTSVQILLPFSHFWMFPYVTTYVWSKFPDLSRRHLLISQAWLHFPGFEFFPHEKICSTSIGATCYKKCKVAGKFSSPA